MVMTLPPSQLAAYIPGEGVNYHTFTFCIDACGTFCWVIYLCWILWAFHPNHFSSGLWIQKPTETKHLSLLDFLAGLILLTIETGYLRILHRLFSHIALDMWNKRLLGSIQSLTIFMRSQRSLKTWEITDKIHVYVCVCISLSIYISMSDALNLRGQDIVHKDANVCVCLQIGLEKDIFLKLRNSHNWNTCLLLSLVPGMQLDN